MVSNEQIKYTGERFRDKLLKFLNPVCLSEKIPEE